MILIFGIANFKNNYGLRKKKISLNKIKDIFSSLEKEKICRGKGVDGSKAWNYRGRCDRIITG